MQQEFLTKPFTTNLKGIAILLVVISHIGDGGFHHRVFVPLGGIGVAIFLILSGYGLMESYKLKGFENYFKNRFMRLYIPYFIWISVYIIIMNSLHLHIGISDIRYWFIEYVSLWYIAFYIILKYFNHYRWPLFGLVALVSFWILPCLQAQQSLSFIVGIVISEYKNEIERIGKGTLWRYVSLFIVIGAFAFLSKQLLAMNLTASTSTDILIVSNVGSDDILRKFVQIFTKLPIALAIILVFQFIFNELYFIRIGASAYELYLVHMPLYHMINVNYLNLIYFLLIISISTIFLGWSNRKVTAFISNSM